LTGDSDLDDRDKIDVIMAKLEEYIFGLPTEEENKFASRYAEPNWHAKTWQLLSWKAFSGPPLGSKKNSQPDSHCPLTAPS
jgi:hypothetical protein